MGYAAPQGLVQFLTIRMNSLINERIDISNEQLEMFRQNCNYTKEFNDAKNYIRGAYSADSVAYQQAMDAVEEENEYNLSLVASWEAELNNEVEKIETESKYIEQQKESFVGIVQQNIEKSHKYGGGSK